MSLQFILLMNLYRLAITFFIISISALNGELFSQYTASGKIVDSKTGDPLSFANIKYSTNNTVADVNGNFSFVNEESSVHMEVSYIGYLPFVLDTFVSSRSNNFGTIRLIADSKTISEITITSGKYIRSIENVTVSMESLKPEFLEKNNTVRFDNILEKIPGVSYVDGQANIRGGSGFTYGAGSRVLILYDNIPALQFDSAFPNWSNIPVESIVKVEVMKGAGSALYGSSAMNGVINILSRYAKKDPFLKIKTFFTFYDSPADTVKKWWDTGNPYKFGISAEYAKKIGKLDMVTSILYQNDPKNFKKDCNSQLGRATLKLDYHINDVFTIGLHSNLNTENRTTFYYWKNSTSGAYIGDEASYSTEAIKVFVFDPHMTYFTKKGSKHTLQSRIYYVTNYLTEEKSNISINTFAEYQYQKNLADLGLIITGGLVNSQGRTDTRHYVDTVFVASNTSLYMQTEKKLWNRLNLDLGARYEINYVKGPKIIDGKDVSDKYKTESKPIFRAGLNYKLFKYTNLRTSWGQGFRYPAIAEKYTNTFTGSLLILPNTDLKSETGYTMEAGIRQGYKLFGLKGFADIAVFQSEYDNMIEYLLKFDKRLYFSAENVGNTIIKGMEFTSGFALDLGQFNLDFTGGYQYIDPRYKNFEDVKNTVSNDTVNILKYRYRHSYRFDSELTYKNFSLGFGSSYNSFMVSVDRLLEQPIIVKGVKEYRTINNKGTNVYRLRGGYKFKKLDFLLNVDNLFNKEYSVRPGLLEAPRSFTFNVSYTID